MENPVKLRSLALAVATALLLSNPPPANAKPEPLPETKVIKKVSRTRIDTSAARNYAQTLVTDPVQFECLSLLWNAESGWNHRAHNRSSGAYGIPQALPGHKMKSAGNDWQTNFQTQINWGLSYIEQRYSDPCGAWNHFKRKNWY